jgi:hypothetical protein
MMEILKTQDSKTYLMKRTYSLNTNTDEYFTCEFHTALKNKLYTDENTYSYNYCIVLVV